MVVLNMGGDVVDTATAIGKLLMTVLAGIAEFEADLIRERQREALPLPKPVGPTRDGRARILGIITGRPMPSNCSERGTPII